MNPVFQTWLLTSLIYLGSLPDAVAQSDFTNHFDFNAGLSTVDAANIGFRYRFGQNHVGINIGGDLPARGFWHVVPSISYYRHLWGTSKYTTIMPWYVKGAVHFEYSESELTRGNFSDTRQAGGRLFVGRDFNLSSRLGFTAAVGPVFIFFEELYDNYRVKPHVEAGMDIMIFYRL